MNFIHRFLLNLLQITVAVKKILYAADEKESLLTEAQEIIHQSMDGQAKLSKEGEEED